MGRHVKRAGRQKIAWFRKKLEPLIEERVRADYTACKRSGRNSVILSSGLRQI